MHTEGATEIRTPQPLMLSYMVIYNLPRSVGISWLPLPDLLMRSIGGRSNIIYSCGNLAGYGGTSKQSMSPTILVQSMFACPWIGCCMLVHDLRPEVPVLEDPAAWWRFAFAVVVDKLRADGFSRSSRFPDMEKRRRMRWVSLFVCVYGGAAMFSVCRIRAHPLELRLYFEFLRLALEVMSVWLSFHLSLSVCMYTKCTSCLSVFLPGLRGVMADPFRPNG